jgi:outer membrane protein assembly factor BamE (lipoprotein component of BamABCDE complex)
MKTFSLLIILLLAGCASTGTGNQKIMDVSFQDKIQVGVTTKDEVRALLGEPSRFTMAQCFDNGNITMDCWRYVGNDRVISPLCYVPLLDLTQKQTIRTRVVDIYFDTNGIVFEVKVGSSDDKRMFAVGTVALITAGVGAICAAGSTPYPSYYANGRWYPGKAIVTTNPIGGGSYQTVIKYYK